LPHLSGGNQSTRWLGSEKKGVPAGGMGNVSTDLAAQWRFVSNLPETIENLTASGGIALPLRDAGAASYQHLNFKRDALFGPYPSRDCSILMP